MHPYRDMPQRSHEPPAEIVDDEPALYATVLVVGAIRIIVTLLAWTTFDRETTLALMMAVIGALGLFRTWRRARGSTRAR